MDRISGFEPDGVGSIPAGPANQNFLKELTNRRIDSIIHTVL